MLQDEIRVPNLFLQLPPVLLYHIIFPPTAENYVQYKVLLVHTERDTNIIFAVIGDDRACGLEAIKDTLHMFQFIKLFSVLLYLILTHLARFTLQNTDF
jgi:hypothetical protein